MVRISDSHSEDPGSIPGAGNIFSIFNSLTISLEYKQINYVTGPAFDINVHNLDVQRLFAVLTK